MRSRTRERGQTGRRRAARVQDGPKGVADLRTVPGGVARFADSRVGGTLTDVRDNVPIDFAFRGLARKRIRRFVGERIIVWARRIGWLEMNDNDERVDVERVLLRSVLITLQITLSKELEETC